MLPILPIIGKKTLNFSQFFPMLLYFAQNKYVVYVGGVGIASGLAIGFRKALIELVDF